MAASEREDFERAKDMRDALRWLERLEEPVSVEVMGTGDADVIGYARDGDDAVGVLVRVREGRVVGREHRFLEGLEEEQDGGSPERVPGALLRAGRGAGAAGGDPVSAGTTGMRCASSSRTPTGPSRSGAPRTAGSSWPITNARHLLESLRIESFETEERAEDPVYALGRDLGLSAVPRSLVCVDISHNQGKDTVGSLVWFEAGRPKKSEYRKFKIKGLGQQDDFAAIHEVITRYLTRRRDEALPLPDLIVIDGGKGQLNAALDAMDKVGLGTDSDGEPRQAGGGGVPPRARRESPAARGGARRCAFSSGRATRRTGSGSPTIASGAPRARSPPSCSTFRASGPTGAAGCSSGSAVSPACDRHPWPSLRRSRDSRRGSPSGSSRISMPPRERRTRRLPDWMLECSSCDDRAGPRGCRPCATVAACRGWSAIPTGRPPWSTAPSCAGGTGCGDSARSSRSCRARSPSRSGEGDTPLLRAPAHGAGSAWRTSGSRTRAPIRPARSSRAGSSAAITRAVAPAPSGSCCRPRETRAWLPRPTAPGRAAGPSVRAAARPREPSSSQIVVYGGIWCCSTATSATAARRARAPTPRRPARSIFHAARAVSDRGQEDAGPGARDAARLDAPGRDHLPHRGRDRPHRHVEGLPRAPGRRLGPGRRCHACTRCRARLRACRPRVRAGRG